MIGSLLHKTLLTGAALAIASPALADVKAGVDAWSRGDYAAAVREWKQPADKGDADAQFNLAQAYKLGRGVPQDLSKATDLFAEAAAQGHIQASDNYGLLLFQSGERARALPYIKAAAERGDARGRYLLGLAYFNGENVPKDWVRAYALVSLAQQAGLPQAIPALTQMDQHIPLDQRRQSVKLAAALSAEADATRARQLAAVDLGSSVPAIGAPRTASMGAPSFPDGPPPVTVPPAPKPPVDYTVRKPAGPSIPAVADIMDAESAPVHAKPVKPVKPAAVAAAKPAKPIAPPPTSKPAPAVTDGLWRVQLGAFGVAGNADALWARVRNRPELAGHGKLLVPAGRLMKLQAGGFASQADAKAACARMTAAGFTCIPARD
jgi:cell division septation protein DedD